MTRASMNTAESTREISYECSELTLDELHQVSGGAAFPPNPCVRAFSGSAGGGTEDSKIIVVC
jgi:hypothetical protein